MDAQALLGPLTRAWSAFGSLLPRLRVVLAFGALTVVAAGGLWAYGASVERTTERRLRAAELTGGNPELAQGHIARYGCAGCHLIPGVRGPQGLVGPPLAGIGRRVYIAGFLPQHPDNLVRWIVNPPALDPQTAMPATGITEGEARDVAAYLYSLR